MGDRLSLQLSSGGANEPLSWINELRYHRIKNACGDPLSEDPLVLLPSAYRPNPLIHVLEGLLESMLMIT